MAVLDDLKASVSGVAASVDAVKARVDSLPSGVNDADLSPLVSQLNDAKAKLDAVAVPVVPAP